MNTVTVELILAAVFLAMANERLVGYFDPVWAKIPLEGSKRYISFLSGALIGWLFQIDLVSTLIPTVPLLPWAGTLLTALVLGGGSNLIHDLWPSAK